LGVVTRWENARCSKMQSCIGRLAKKIDGAKKRSMEALGTSKQGGFHDSDHQRNDAFGSVQRGGQIPGAFEAESGGSGGNRGSEQREAEGWVKSTNDRLGILLGLLLPVHFRRERRKTGDKVLQGVCPGTLGGDHRISRPGRDHAGNDRDFVLGLKERERFGRKMRNATVRKHCRAISAILKTAGPRTERQPCATGLISFVPPFPTVHVRLNISEKRRPSGSSKRFWMSAGI